MQPSTLLLNISFLVEYSYKTGAYSSKVMVDDREGCVIGAASATRLATRMRCEIKSKRGGRRRRINYDLENNFTA